MEKTQVFCDFCGVEIEMRGEVEFGAAIYGKYFGNSVRFPACLEVKGDNEWHDSDICPRCFKGIEIDEKQEVIKT